MKVLFIGGTGVISSACSEKCIDSGFDLYLLNRGQSLRKAPKKAHILTGNIRDRKQISELLKDHIFDVVVDWIAFTPEHIETDLALFQNRVGQYIFISSASAYQTPPSKLPVTESTILDNPYWEYSRNKIACEERLIKAYREQKFPVTIVRPSHTYDKTMPPYRGGYTVINRIRTAKKIIVYGDGTSLWTLTHHRDFATGFVGLLGNYTAIGEVFHITSDEVLSWNQITEILATAAGTPADVVNIPSKFIASFDKEWGANIISDKSVSMIFDNSKIKRFVPDFSAGIPFSVGVQEIINWYDEDKNRQLIDNQLDRTMDKIIAAFEPVWRKYR